MGDKHSKCVKTKIKKHDRIILINYRSIVFLKFKLIYIPAILSLIG